MCNRSSWASNWIHGENILHRFGCFKGEFNWTHPFWVNWMHVTSSNSIKFLIKQFAFVRLPVMFSTIINLCCGFVQHFEHLHYLLVKMWIIKITHPSQRISLMCVNCKIDCGICVESHLCFDVNHPKQLNDENKLPRMRVTWPTEEWP